MNWSYTPKIMDKIVTDFINGYSALIDKIMSLENPSYKETFGEMNNYFIQNIFEVNKVFLTDKIVSNAEIFRASLSAKNKYDKFQLECARRKDIYHLARDVLAREKEFLNEEQKRYLDREIGSAERSGLHFADEIQVRIAEIVTELTEKCHEFRKNVITDGVRLRLTRKELEGVNSIQLDLTSRDNDDKYVVADSDYARLIECATNPETRRKLYLLRANSATENSEVLRRILDLRAEWAQLLGYSNWAEMILKKNTLNTPEKVKKFLTDLADEIAPIWEKELAELAAIKGAEIEAHDVRFYLERHLEKHRKMKLSTTISDPLNFLSIDRVIDFMLFSNEKLFNIKFYEVAADTWHRDVFSYEVRERGGESIGIVHMDIYSREGKHFPILISHYLLKSPTLSDNFGISCVIAGLHKSSNVFQSFITIHNVRELFRNFAHAVHNLFAKTEILALSGPYRRVDSADIQSQMCENIIFESDHIMQMVHREYMSPRLAPPVQDKTKLIKDHYSVHATLMLITLSIIDIDIHTQDIQDLDAHYDEVTERITKIREPEKTSRINKFLPLTTHSANYYSYLWNRACAQDLYHSLQEQLSADPMAALNYRKKILEPGNSRDMGDMVRDFLGRDVDYCLFMRELAQ